jgi:large subunit ribosomal protein L17
MRHLKSGRKLKRTASHRHAMLCNMATSLLEHKKVATTEAKAKELRPFVERLITKAKNSYLAEQNGAVTDVHTRRIVARYVKTKAVVQELFETIAPVVENRPGGYSRIIKTGTRHGDGGRTAVIELVDWSEQQDGRAKLGRRKKRTNAATQTPAQTRLQQQVAQSVDEASTQLETVQTVDDTPIEENISVNNPDLGIETNADTTAEEQSRTEQLKNTQPE